MKRYFVAQCDDEGEVDGSITEVYPPYGISIGVGIVIGLIIGVIL